MQVLLLGLLTAIDAMSIDVYLPASALMRQDFGTSEGRIQDAMSVFLGGMVVGQLTWGPISDQFGRRRPLLTGLTLFCVGSLLALLASDVSAMIVARFLQAIGASAGIVIARAMVHDLYDGAEAPKIYSLLMQILGLTALVSPLIGGAILLSGRWRPIFVFLLAIGLVCTLSCFIRVPESLPDNHRTQADTRLLLRNYLALLGSRPYMCAALASAFSMAGMFGLLSGSAFYFVQQAHWSSVGYAVLYAFTSLTFIIACQINIRALKTMPPGRICSQALVGQLILAVVLASLVATAAAGPWSVAILMTGLLALLGFIIGNTTACVMSGASGNAGAASGLLGVLQFTASAVVVPLVTISGNIGLSMSLTIAGCALLAVLAWLGTDRGLDVRTS